MRIGVPREIKIEESRVGLTPAGVRELKSAGHEVMVEAHAGEGIGIVNLQYEAAGARIGSDAAEVFRFADLIVKVKEPQPTECRLLRDGQVIFTFLHLAADPGQARALMDSGATAIAYETVTAPDGSLPLLAPMSEVAGRMSMQVAARCLEKPNGGSGLLLGGVPGVPAAKVVVLGGGVAGSEAVAMAVGLQADVTVVDRSLPRLRALAAQYGSRLKTVFSTAQSIEEAVEGADVVIGAVLIPGAAAPKLVTRAMVADMRPRSVIMDIAIDQGGCIETSRPTTHAAPTYLAEGVVHYCVTNMPGAVPRTSTHALTSATLPFVRTLADLGWRAALKRDPHLAHGLNVQGGEIKCAAVAAALERKAA
ncbi:MAG: alanine dehydrogenase [Steroidobacteraceae bacterium]